MELVLSGETSSLFSPVRHQLLRREPIHHGDTPPFDVCPPLTGRRVGGAVLVGEGERGLQVAQRESPADGTVDVGPAVLGDHFTLTHVEADELLDRVEAVRLQNVLHLEDQDGNETLLYSHILTKFTTNPNFALDLDGLKV